MIEQIRFVETTRTLNSEPLSEMVEVYDGKDPLDWCVRGYKSHLIDLWVNSGLFGEGGCLVHLSHIRPWDNENSDHFHDWICTGDDWNQKYRGIEKWGINDGINWHKKYDE